MNKRRSSLMLIACVPMLAVLVACASAGSGGHDHSAGSGSVDELVRLLEVGVESDYDPLESPADAVKKGDLIVRGVLAEVTDGATLQFDDPLLTQRRSNTYATMVVEVTKVLSGDPAAVTDGKVYVEVPRSPVSRPPELSRANPRADVVVVLDDLRDWRPRPDARLVAPVGVPAGAALYAPFTDGLWLQGPGDRAMRGVGVEAEKLAPAWGPVRTVDEFASTIDRARN